MSALLACLLTVLRGTAFASNESTTASIAGPATIEGRCSPVTVSASMALSPSAAKPGVFISKVDIYSGIYACGSDAKQTTDSVSYRYDAASSESIVVLPPGTGHGSTLVEIAPGYVYQADAPAVPPIPPGPYSSTNDSKAEEMKGYGTAWHGDARVTINWDCCAFKPQAAAKPAAKPASKPAAAPTRAAATPSKKEKQQAAADRRKETPRKAASRSPKARAEESTRCELRDICSAPAGKEVRFNGGGNSITAAAPGIGAIGAAAEGAIAADLRKCGYETQTQIPVSTVDCGLPVARIMDILVNISSTKYCAIEVKANGSVYTYKQQEKDSECIEAGKAKVLENLKMRGVTIASRPKNFHVGTGNAEIKAGAQLPSIHTVVVRTDVK